MDSTLATKHDLRTLEQKMEDNFRRLELRQIHESLERSVTFWFGLAFFTVVGLAIALILDLA